MKKGSAIFSPSRLNKEGGGESKNIIVNYAWVFTNTMKTTIPSGCSSSTRCPESKKHIDHQSIVSSQEQGSVIERKNGIDGKKSLGGCGLIAMYNVNKEASLLQTAVSAPHNHNNKSPDANRKFKFQCNK